MDRYIPSAASTRAYRALRSESEVNPLAAKWSQVHQIRDESLLNLSQTTVHEGIQTLSNDFTGEEAAQREPNSTQDTNSLYHRNVIADALDFLPQNRVFTFSSPSHMKNKNSLLNSDYTTQSGNSSIHSSSTYSASPAIGSFHSGPLFSDDSFNLSSRTSMDSNSSHGSSPKPKKKVQSYVPYRVLDAPFLRNDFYTNLISWSKKTKMVAVGLESSVYLWKENGDVLMLQLPENDIVSAVSFSDCGLIAIGSKSGRVTLFYEEVQYEIGSYVHSDVGICCIAWLPNLSKFYVGNEVGELLFFEIQNNDTLVMAKSFKCHQQQICGIAVSHDIKQIAVGGNDNCCSIWDIEDLKHPVTKFLLPHTAAVKAIAYCPWSKSLLVTGGGSKDRTIRFWHTKSGTLLQSFPTTGQITSLMWSTKKKQLAATFGFNDSSNSFLISVFSYPKMEALVQVEASPDLRIVSAVISPDSSSICVAVNDETIRFYELWDPSDNTIVESQEGGVLGSELIELQEGITKNGDAIR